MEFGERLEPQEDAVLTVAVARAAATAVREDHSFRLVELRRDEVSEILVVECRTHVFPKNACGIRFCEPLALRFFRDESRLLEVRALRTDFPELLHENEQPAGEPVGLCVYQEPWSELRRTWTVQQFLRRIQWWLNAAAENRLHPSDLRPEQLFFSSPVIVVLPNDFDSWARRKDHAAILEPRTPIGESEECVVAIATFRPISEVQRNADRTIAVVSLELPEVEHGRPERAPATLGDLHDRLAKRGAPIETLLLAEIRRIAEGGGLPYVADQRTLLILTTPVRNPGGATVIERRGFLIDVALGELGVRAGVFGQIRRNSSYAPLVARETNSEWRFAKVLAPVDLREGFTAVQARRYSGLDDKGPCGALAGYGALGSAILDSWMREGWGKWSIVDPDVLFPHNLSRHRAWDSHVGAPKVAVAQDLHAALYPRAPRLETVQASATDFGKRRVVDILKEAELIVDTTTSVSVPRDLSRREELCRCASAFITPTGNDSVLLMEDAKRITRLDCLEPQYYRFVLNAPWGATHLKGHRGEQYVGAGCRDISATISIELVQLHGALLARQIRLRRTEVAAQVQVWRAHPETGEVTAHPLGISAPLFDSHLGFDIVWDEGLQTKLRGMREQSLPKESGGILLGYADSITKRIYVVDALSPPPDSYQSREEFQRGVQGLAASVAEAAARTANIVNYIGEWHSHPRGVEADLSVTDLFQLIDLALLLRQDGAPALMLIAGESGEAWYSGQVR